MSEGQAKPILCLDFDGVIHSYTSGWQGARVIADNVTDGFFEWLEVANKHFQIVVYSSRSKEPGAIDAMMFWLADQRRKWRERSGHTGDQAEVRLEFTDTKPPAFLQIDDRAICFNGDWSALDPVELLKFKPWNKRPPSPGNAQSGLVNLNDQYQPLPVVGYTEQSGDNISTVNINKQIEERVLQRLDFLAARPEIDKRWLAIARTHIEQGFMAANRAVFKPERVQLNDPFPPKPE